MDQTDEQQAYAKAKKRGWNKIVKADRESRKEAKKYTDREFEIIYARRYSGIALSQVFKSVADRVAIPEPECRYPNPAATALDHLFDDLQKLVHQNGWDPDEWFDWVNDALRDAIGRGLGAAGITEENTCLSADELGLMIQLADPASSATKKRFFDTFRSFETYKSGVVKASPVKLDAEKAYEGPERRSSEIFDRRRARVLDKNNTPKPS